MKKRRATSLIELLIIMSAATVILTMSTSLIHRILHTQSKTRRFCDVERGALRLSEQFRRDVQGADTATLEATDFGEGPFLRLQLTGSDSIEYRHRKGRVVRNLLQQGQVKSREEFVFPANSELKIQEEPSPPMIVLSLTSTVELPSAENRTPLAGSHANPVSFEVVARLNRQASQATATENVEDLE